MSYTNLQLEKILSKLSTIDAVTASGAIEKWWDNSVYKSRILDVIDISGTTGVLKSNTVNASIIKDGVISFTHLYSPIDWSKVATNPSGSSSSDYWSSYLRSFVTRGSSYVMLYNNTESVSLGFPHADFVSCVPSSKQEYIPVLNDLLYDESFKIPRYPTLRFEMILTISSSGAGSLDKSFLNFTLNQFDRSTNSVKTLLLQVDSGSPFYNSNYTAEITGSSWTEDDRTKLIGITGELNLNKDSFLSSVITEFPGKMNLTNYPLNQIVNLSDPNISYKDLHTYGFLSFKPTIKCSSGTNVTGINIIRFSAVLVNKVIGNNGWIIVTAYNNEY